MVAHPDDDLFFVNPDTAQGIRQGVPTCVVLVTAGEFNGDDISREHYAESRRLGACAAYAYIAGVPNQWTRQVKQVAGRDVEMDVLTGKPTVRLLLIGLPDAFDDEQLHALPKMWQDDTAVAHTLVYPGSPVARSYNYDRSQLLAALVSIMKATTPTVIRAQDANPDPFLRGDHADHVTVSRFAAEAMRNYVAAGGRPPQLVEYCDYNNADHTPNLAPDVATDQRAAFEVYHPFDPGAQDLDWLGRNYPRWGHGTTWAGTDGDGRVHAFCVLGDAVWCWPQDQPGGAWRQPVNIGGGPIASNLAVGPNADGRLAVFAVSLASHDLVVSYQLGIDGPYSPWVSLGNPNGPGGLHTGAPAVGVNADGRLTAFVKNSGGGISCTYQTAPNAGFSPWVDFGGGPDIQATPAVILGQDSRMALFATTRSSVLRWQQNSPNAGWSGPFQLASVAAASAVTAALNADGRIAVFYRSTLGVVHCIYQTTQGTWSSPPTVLGGDGIGPLATVCADQRIFLLSRNAFGGISTACQEGPNRGFPEWIQLGGATTGTPSLTVGSDGRPLALVLGTEGVLWVGKLTNGPDLATPWQKAYTSVPAGQPPIGPALLPH
ncbi:MAG: PIG-L family deacetylase [Labedaea sp.]